MTYADVSISTGVNFTVVLAKNSPWEPSGARAKIRFVFIFKCAQSLLYSKSCEVPQQVTHAISIVLNYKSILGTSWSQVMRLLLMPVMQAVVPTLTDEKSRGKPI